jgi:hypothetical protein
MNGLYGDVDITRVMFGQHAIHVPAWLIVQDQGEGLVAFVGSSRLPVTNHPLRYGSERTHQRIVGEIIIRPHEVRGTDARRGDGLSGLAGDVWRGFDEGERIV